MYRQLDESLSSCIDVIALSLSHEIEEHEGKAPGEEAFRGIIAIMHQRSFPQQAIAVFDGPRLVAQKTGDFEINVKTPPAPGLRTRFQATTESAGIPVRVVQRTISVPGVKEPYTLVACQPLRSLEMALGSLRLALLFLVPVAILLSGAGGYYLARESLRPVVAMADAVDQLNARNLSGTLPVLNSRDELGHLAQTFNALLSRLNAALENQRQFMADASHELRTPLSITLVTAQVALEQDRSGTEYRQALQVVRNQTERLSRMVQDMFLLTSSDAGGYVPHLRECDLFEIMVDAVESGRVLAREKNLQIKVPEFMDAPISADPALLQQLILILLDNAIKYSGDGTSIELALQVEAGTYRLRITDQGEGIPEFATQRIFDRFFRVEQTRVRSSGSGAGLGLPIARWIATIHGGTVELVETGPKGTTFEVRLPTVVSGEAKSNSVLATARV
jgi:heavy metal sensor kinase